MIEILRTEFFVVVWKVIVFIGAIWLLRGIGQNMIASYKRGGIKSILDELLMGVIVLVVFFICVQTDLATLISKIMPTIKWAFGSLIEALSKVTGIPIG